MEPPPYADALKNKTVKINFNAGEEKEKRRDLKKDTPRLNLKAIKRKNKLTQGKVSLIEVRFSRGERK